MKSSDSPLSLQNILAGIIITVIGGVILAFILKDARFDPSREPVKPTPKPEPQIVEWVPLDATRGTGICINGCTEFIPWLTLRDELQLKVLPQVANVPPGSMLTLGEFQGQPNWIIQVIDPHGNEVANIWMGKNPLNNWAYDGLVRVGHPSAPVTVWATFQRYSDGSYWKQ